MFSGSGTSAFIFLSSPVYNVVQFSYRLALIPDRLQGRVNSVFRLLAFGFQPLGAVLAGILIQAVGPISTVLLFSVWMVLLAVTTSLNAHIRRARPLSATTA